MVLRLLFVCVGNAFRSQIAEGYARALAGRRVLVRSGGLKPAKAVDPVAIQLMAEEGIDLSRHVPKTVDLAFARQADHIAVMGCDPEEACPAEVLDRVVDWQIPDPKGVATPEARAIRDSIKERVRDLLDRL